ncbi:MAG TPA: class I SAM-dependent methyltransferase [Kofleriaceae bacterium]|jgi:ubiquinone/menaquinone biosynthesis C-methylase UbiE|nr:class I SAM-dependent methyltransferase [Kofleriaceae bacterium]
MFAAMVVAGVAAVVLAQVAGIAWLGITGGWLGGFGLVCGGSYLYATLRGKHVVWTRLLDQMALRGDETIVDVGCGRGAVLLLAAARVPKGNAIGIDIWATRDQSGNAEAATRANAELEGVADRTLLVTADMRALPLADASADVVVSSLAIHNVPGADERAKAIAEIARVLKPGGRAVIVDINFTRAYAAELERCGVDVTTRGLGPRFWFGGPQVAARGVFGTKR